MMSKPFHQKVLWGVGTLALGVALAAGTYVLDDAQKAMAVGDSKTKAIYRQYQWQGAGNVGVAASWKDMGRHIVNVDNAPRDFTFPANCITRGPVATVPDTATSMGKAYNVNVVAGGSARLATQVIVANIDMTTFAGNTTVEAIKPGDFVRFNSAATAPTSSDWDTTNKVYTTSTKQRGKGTECCYNRQTGDVFGIGTTRKGAATCPSSDTEFSSWLAAENNYVATTAADILIIVSELAPFSHL